MLVKFPVPELSVAILPVVMFAVIAVIALVNIVVKAAIAPVRLVTVVDPSVEDPMVKKLAATSIPVFVDDPVLIVRTLAF
jgi:hypothetical protein